MKTVFSFLCIVVCVFSCDSTTPPSVTELVAPVLVSSVPAAHTEDLPAGDWTVTLVFDQNIFSPSAGHSRISIDNDAKVGNVSANLKELKINLSELKKSTSYTLVIPKGVVLGPTQVEAEEIRVAFSTIGEQALSGALCTPNPSPEAATLYNYLRENYGKKTISGAVAQVAWNIDEAERVYRWTGKYPKINVFDYIHLWASPANWIDYGNISVVEKWHNAGGIVGAMWHWNVPKSQTAAATDVTFRPNETTFRTANATISGTWENTVVNTDLGKIADYLLLLKNKNIPVLWRPLHEAAGNIYAWPTGNPQNDAWFWWGNDGAEAYKALWRYMFDFFKNKGLNNLIWIFTTQTDKRTDSDDMPFYPGDEYVDIVGRDSYGNGTNWVVTPAVAAAEFNAIKSHFPNKMVTLAEMGDVSPISAQWQVGAQWLWFMPWYDNDAADSDNPPHDHAGKQWWTDAMNQQFVITR